MHELTFRPEICEKYFLSFPQKIFKLRQLRQLILSQFVYFLREVCLLFNFWMLKFTIMSKKHMYKLRQTKLSQFVYFWGNERKYFSNISGHTLNLNLLFLKRVEAQIHTGHWGPRFYEVKPIGSGFGWMILDIAIIAIHFLVAHLKIHLYFIQFFCFNRGNYNVAIIKLLKQNICYEDSNKNSISAQPCNQAGLNQIFCHQFQLCLVS